MPSPAETRSSSAAPGLAAAAATALVLALAVSSGLYDPVGLALVSASGIAALTATLVARRDGPHSGIRAAAAILAVAIAASIVRDLLVRPGIAVDPAPLGFFRPLLGIIAGLLLSYAWRAMPRWAARTRFAALVALATGLGALVLLASPEPPIDVWLVQQQGSLALLAGRNPYEVLYANIYGPGSPFMDPGVLTPDGRFLTAYPYMPLILLVDAPSAFLGDVRWTMLAAAAVSACLVRALGRGAVAAEFAGLLLLVQPVGWTVLEYSWTEPIVLATILIMALTIRRSAERSGHDGLVRKRSWLLPGLAAALALSSKQYVALLALPFLIVLPTRNRGRAALVAAAGAGVLVLPFLIANPAAFVRGVLEFQLRQPFRPDALSWPAAIVHLGGPRLPPWPAFLLAGGVLWATLGRRVSVAQAILASASTWIVFVAFNKQAFANYYWLGVGLLCAAVAALAAGSPSEGPVGPDRA
jgi:hypothetical protein